MIPKECKRLAEVDFPIAEVSKHSSREKSIRHGHPSTLHLWWARRPLASCRAMLMALLLPDPCDEHCPEDFKIAAKDILLSKPNRPTGWTSAVKTTEGLRKVLLKFISDFSNWDNSSDKDYLETARTLIKAAHPEETPLVVDAFAGGGSIPLETLRLNCEVFASDLNPVACLILKVMLEDIPRSGPELADELRKVGKEIRKKAELELKDFYEDDPDGAKPIAYLWARTVKCESPNCGAEIPVFRSAWLSKKGARKAQFFKKDENGRCFVLLIDKAPIGGPIHFQIARGVGCEEPKTGYIRPACTKAPGNTANVICPCCGTILPGNKKNPRVAAQLNMQLGGADVDFDENGERVGGARLLAVVTIGPGNKRRSYRLPNLRDYNALHRAKCKLMKIKTNTLDCGLTAIPDESFHSVRPSPNSRGLSAVTRYGMTTFASLYTSRQLLSLNVFNELIRSHQWGESSGEYKAALQKLLALTVSRVTDYCSAQSRWDSTQERNVNSFGRQALPMLWDFAELVPFADCVGSFLSMLNGIIRFIERNNSVCSYGQVQCANATNHPLPDESAPLWFIDPPYYDSVPYADLSDFFYVWLKRMLVNEPILKGLYECDDRLTPKIQECVWNRAYKVKGKTKDPAFFEDCVSRAFVEGRRITKADGLGCVIFAHKTTEGWEALLSGLTRAGWVVTGSWPIATEQKHRLVARDSAALATSVHLICRPRAKDARVGDWAEVLSELPDRVGNWMERLQGEGVRGADLVFACIGPALEIFSQYSKVETAEGREVPLSNYMEKVWEVVGRLALEQVLGTAEARTRNGLAGALEEDARLTALFLWTFQSTKSANNNNGKTRLAYIHEESDNEDSTPMEKTKAGFSLPYDVVRRFAQPLGINLPKWEGRIIETKKGIVRLLPISERTKQLVEPTVAMDISLVKSSRKKKRSLQMRLFENVESLHKEEHTEEAEKRLEMETWAQLHKDTITTLDHVQKAMLFQKQGQTNALRELLFYEIHYRPDFIRLANALSALYPSGSEEKRLLDAMLLAIPR